MKNIKILFLFSILFFSCEKEIIKPEMKQSEKILLKALEGKNISEKGKISIEVRSKTYLLLVTGVAPITYIITDYTNSINTIKLQKNLIPLFSYVDFLNNYTIANKFQLNTQFFTGTVSQFSQIDNKKFFIVSDSRNPYIPDIVIGTSEILNIPIQAITNTSLRIEDQFFNGDILLIQFNKHNPLTGVWVWTEILIKCKEYPYASLIKLIDEPRYKLTYLKHIPGSSSPDGFTPQLRQEFLTYYFNVFGKIKTNVINPGAYLPPENFNSSTFVEIPLNFKIQNSGFIFYENFFIKPPITYTNNINTFIFTLQLN